MARTHERGGPGAEAATDLKRFLPHSLVATSLVAGLPLWVAFGLGASVGPTASLISMGLSLALGRAGAWMWQRHPGSRDLVFNDLMLWGYVRRVRTRRGLLKKVERLGFGGSTSRNLRMNVEDQTRLLKKLAIALESGDKYTHGHSQRVARHAYMVAKAMHLPRKQREKIRLAGIVHDVGKLRIPREVVNKPGRLTDAEYALIKEHAGIGGKMVGILDDPELTDMVRHHHERLDGSGYPDALKGEDISIGARILAVADVFDATSSERPYRAAQKHKVALDILRNEAGPRLDAKVVDAFIRYYSGRRSVRWWWFVTTAPAHMRELVLLLMQRLGTVGLANAAVVGATAVALAPGGLAHPRSEPPGRAVATQVSHASNGEEVAGANGTRSRGNPTHAAGSSQGGRGGSASDRRHGGKDRVRPGSTSKPDGGKPDAKKGSKDKAKDNPASGSDQDKGPLDGGSKGKKSKDGVGKPASSPSDSDTGDAPDATGDSSGSGGSSDQPPAADPPSAGNSDKTPPADTGKPDAPPAPEPPAQDGKDGEKDRSK